MAPPNAGKNVKGMERNKMTSPPRRSVQRNRRVTHSTQFNLPSSLSVDSDDDVAVLCLSRAEKRNAIDDAMIHGIDHFFGELPGRIRAVVIRAKGDHFCAGADLSVIADNQCLFWSPGFPREPPRPRSD